MKKILISACLLGQPVRYDGRASSTDRADLLRSWQNEGRLVPICPEVAGGLGVPRPPAELVGGTGDAVLDGEARLLTAEGADVTDAYLAGARLALAAAQTHQVACAILKARSPSCGTSRVYDGSFSRTLIDGQGVTAALLIRHEIPVFSEDELEAARAYLDGQ
jgi:uncharacterized protein YbbK (DUF523 family)